MREPAIYGQCPGRFFACSGLGRTLVRRRNNPDPDIRVRPRGLKVDFLDKKSIGQPLADNTEETTGASRPPRTNLLLSATIEADGISGPVRIRNLSQHGALLEGAALPPVGAGVVLRRLQLEMGATVIWADKSRCGVRFEGSISVSGWREGNWIAPVGHAGQIRVDGIQSAVRSGEAVPTMPAGVAARNTNLSRAEMDQRIAEELTVLQHLLEDMGTQLVDVVETNGKAMTLQQFDLAAQTLGHLADVLKADDRRAAIDAIGMERLRLRLMGAKPDEGA
ncbi:MAG: PilZ domain-containing protein [Alphaproteobacteria bacterium]|nr:PilZ domain-containing protein [Alphaproteobacteria bacterium]MBU0794767.1 PilZ domain-containing protein [Alphaproteobacteria bacterium]MBU0874332.1 PilZ domain-containing protein [Alphaproteobacteria bacterium]MBU1769664.1 PilZ domain-containing protein [Alphaproteobacteria bacterium]